MPPLADPRLLARLPDLELVARRVVDGFMFGRHPSTVVGPGLEFSQYRSYQPGDDPRRVDWRLYARSDRYYIREAERDTSVTIRLILDASESMAQEDDGVSLLDWARVLVAALALLAQRQGDAVSLAVLGGEAELVPAGRGDQHLHRVLLTLQRARPEGTWPDWERLAPALLKQEARGVAVIVSDMHEREAEVRRAAMALAAVRQDVRLIHLASRRELELDWSGPVVFEEFETGRRLELDPDLARPAYQARLARELDTLRRDLAARDVVYHRVITDQPVEQVLQTLFRRRRAD